MTEQLAEWESEAIRLSDAVEAEIREAARNTADDHPQRCGHSSSPMCCPFENFPTLAKWFMRIAADRAAWNIRMERDGYLDSPGLDRAWVAGWHAATDHHAARLTPDSATETSNETSQQAK